MRDSLNREPQTTALDEARNTVAYRSASNERSVHRSRPAMGTHFEALLLGDDEEHLAAVADAVLDEVQRIERLLSRFDRCSEISRINRLAAREPVQIDLELAQVLRTCFEAWRLTGGAFDITLGSAGQVHVPSVEDGCNRWPGGNVLPPGIDFNFHRRLIRLQNSAIQLDLGAFGKGYALDRAAEILAEFGIEHALLHGGTSSVLARGCNIDGQPWRIALRDFGGRESGEVIELTDAALSCSGVNESGDVLDPRTGIRLSGRSLCAVVAPTASEAEILSTARLVRAGL
jgi:thiamine biosynthesis lipoprotein